MAEENKTPETKWLYDVVGGFHDRSCECAGHCPNCFCNVATDGVLGPKARYCSQYCKGRAKRERELDRWLANIPTYVARAANEEKRS